MKQVVFNVGGALSTYIEYSGKKLLIDVGKNKDFNPIIDFLKPLYEKRNAIKTNNKWDIDQLIISHPHNDHISAIEDFDKYFMPGLLTSPNSNSGQDNSEKVDWDLVDNPNNDYVDYLKSMLEPRNPPLKSSNPSDLFIYYIKPNDCKSDEKLAKENYTNNLSIAAYLRIDKYRIFMPGDLMKDGMEYMINNRSSLRNRLEEGVDVLIAPHHGLKSSFSTCLFSHMKNGKTCSLNIISEKPTSEDSNRVVDTRYSSTNYCEGKNNLSTKDAIVCQKKTSTGHIFIDYTCSQYPKFEVINDNKTLLSRF
jgi:competence protein ComEC